MSTKIRSENVKNGDTVSTETKPKSPKYRAKKTFFQKKIVSFSLTWGVLNNLKLFSDVNSPLMSVLQIITTDYKYLICKMNMIF